MADTTDEDKHRPDEATEEVKDTDAPAPDASSHDASAEAPAPSTTKHDETAEPAEEPKPKPKPAPASPNKIKRRPVPSALELEGTSYADGPNIAVSSAATLATLERAAEVEKDHAPDSPTTSLIAALRSQLELVSEQAGQLNSKLVASISRHADLEDQVYTLEGERREQNERVVELERDKARWEESMNTGLLVERDQIRDEMQRLAAGLVEEERRRGSAEERREQVENEVDDLAATLFDQANTMVATERMSRAQAEERLKESEENLAAAEAAVRDMQLHLQSLSTPAESSAGGTAAASTAARHILASHPPYAEFLAFVQHIRVARPRKGKSRDLYPAPLATNLLTHPFLVRAILEDHEPTLRLDAAPELSFLSRPRVNAAIISGELLIEPVNAAALGPPENVKCAMCGTLVFGAAAHGQGARLASSRFSLKPFFSSPGTPVNSALASSTSVYVFRAATGAEKDARAYPLCKNGWCLERLRAACALWHFVRTGIVQSLWFSEDVTHSRNPSAANAAEVVAAAAAPVTPAAPTDAAPDDGTPRPVDLSRTPPDADKLSLSPAPPALPERPAVAQRKSGWGLGGFKWSRNTPPTTPGPDTPKESTFAALIATGPDAKAAEALGAPINLGEEEKRDEVRAVKEGETEEEPKEDEEADEKEKSEEKEKAEEVAEAKQAEKTEEKAETSEKADDKKAEEAGDDKPASPAADASKADHADDTQLSRSGSRTGSEAETASFATPHNEPADLPEEEGSEAKEEAKAEEKEKPEEKAEEKAAEDKPASTTDSPSPSSSPPKSDSPPPPPRSKARGAAPPPLPRRAPARKVAPEAVVSPPDTPTEARHADADAKAEEPPAEEPATPTTATATEAPTTGNSAATLVEPTPVPAPAVEHARSASGSGTRVPPPLPPRHPRTPNAPVEGRTSSEEMPPPPLPVPRTEKSFLAGDAWETRTWRQVVKLKEDMWRARVGVVDDDE